ncbi:putative EsaC protein -like (Listeria type 3) [Lactococcus cremoris]|uniref:Putative EsaC protein-like (Listeria type 3) n=1 Tax=Lactococcus lactis subsp. cremoris TaxID=1359 RepID=A0A166IU45_LACLC|nr:DUF4176 domain-containing protein [Lactococcus cremoris]KZK04954.1 putative EsaC protein -like (Listeria type 3) [Lactococcus cremoris]
MTSTYEQILPIGTIIITKDGNVPLMIVSRGALFDNNGKVGYFDYSAIPYPSGITDGEEFAFFNREDIESVIYFGYRNSDEQIFSENYDELVSGSGYKKLNIKDS